MPQNQNENYVMNYVAVHAFFLNEKGETLVLQRSPENRYMPLRWDIPGGKMLLDENIEETAIRETKEETGLDIEYVGKPLSIYVNRDQLPIRKDVQIIVDCKIKDTSQPIFLSSREHCGYKWILPKDLPSVDCMDYLTYFYQQMLGENK